MPNHSKSVSCVSYMQLCHPEINHQLKVYNGCVGPRKDPSHVTSLSKGGLPHSLCAYGLLHNEDGVAVYMSVDISRLFS